MRLLNNEIITDGYLSQIANYWTLRLDRATGEATSYISSDRGARPQLGHQLYSRFSDILSDAIIDAAG